MDFKLKPTIYKGITQTYKLSQSARARHMALDEYIKKSAKTYGSIRKAAVKKKARLNVLRIYRRYRYKTNCIKLTRDMKYLDRKYIPTGVTRNIC
jgi:hypothetical protein